MKKLDTSSRVEQRKFGLLMAAAISVVGCIRWGLHGFEHIPTYFFAVAAVFLVLGLAVPKVLEPLFVVWMKFAEVLNWVMTRLLLSVAFFLLITPVRILVAIFSEDPLKRKWLPSSESYWEAAEEQPKELKDYRNQF